MYIEKKNKPILLRKLFIPFLGLASLFSFPFSTVYSLFFLVTLYIFFFIRNKGPVLLFSLFSFISITPFLLESAEIKTTFYNQYYSSSYYDDVFFSYLLFLIIFLVGINGLNINSSTIINKYKKRDIYFKLCVFIQIFILLFGKTGDTILSTGYGNVNSNVFSSFLGFSINEYYLIFLVITLFIYKPKKYIHMLNILFVVKNILYGGRVEALQIIFAYSIFLNINFKSVKNLLIGFVLVVAFQVIGSIRHLGLSPEVISNALSDLSVFKLAFLQGATSTFAEVIYSSSVMQGIVNDNLISLSLRLEMVTQHFFSYVFPYSFLNEKANISLFSQSISMGAGGGGLPSAYFYFIGGLPFVIIGSLIYMNIFRKMHKSQNYIFNALGILMLITIPRWLLYNHITFIKSSFYLLIILYFFYKVKVKSKPKIILKKGI